MLSILNGAYLHTSQTGKKFYLDYAPDKNYPVIDLHHLLNLIRKFNLFSIPRSHNYYPYIAVYNNRMRRARLNSNRNILIKYLI